MKINASTKSLVERLCDFKIESISVLALAQETVRGPPHSPCLVLHLMICAQ